MLAETCSATLQGVNALPVTVEVNGGEKGEPRCILVGLPDAAVKESLDRVLSSLANTGYSSPRTRVTINLAPGDLRKEGAAFDLPIALCLLAAMGQMPGDKLKDYLIAGELGLSGETRRVRGGLSMAMLASKAGKKGVALPRESAEEACLMEGMKVYPMDSLAQAVSFFSGETEQMPMEKSESPYQLKHDYSGGLDFSEVKGQANLRRAVEVAVAGGHNLLMLGPPGSGKSMVAKRIPSILPQPSLAEFLEILNVYSAGGNSLIKEGKALSRPVRAPHHTISDVGLLGGGTIPGPGEISLAHNGVLFLDELPEFKRSALEVLRQPLEDGEVTISRSAGKITLPSRFMLVAAMNPCPCGYLGDTTRECRCSMPQIQRYRARVSGPLLDRIDIHVEAPAVRVEDLQVREKGEPSEEMRKRVEGCRAVQHERFKKTSITCNANMPNKMISEFCDLSDDDLHMLRRAMNEFSLSARAYDRILKVSRTIADLNESESIRKPHLLEAIQYRSMDRSFIL
jgi:magnesium chelatase family protein